ncbi:MAG: Gp138 family membrane-puncturing spike protein [Sulfolobaceae archaeon]
MSSPSEIFRDSVLAITGSMHTALPAIVTAFDTTTNKVSVQPALNKAYLSGEMALPILKNVPLIFPNNIIFPISVGQYVLLIFCERSLDLWKSVGGQVTPKDPRQYDLSDAIAIPGLKPFSDTFEQNSGTDFKISYAGSEISISESGAIQIKTASTVAIGNEIVELLQKISDTLAGIAAITTTITVPPGGIPPTPFPIDNAATFISLQSDIDSIKGVIT